MAKRAMWASGPAVRFPELVITRGPAPNMARAEIYLFNGRPLVEAIMDGLLGEAAAKQWSAAPKMSAFQDFEIAGILRALDRGCLDFEVVHIPTVMARDGWRCHICKGDILKDISHGPERASLDHVIPIASGGGHTYENVRASHWRCNHKKGSRVLH